MKVFMYRETGPALSRMIGIWLRQGLFVLVRGVTFRLVFGIRIKAVRLAPNPGGAVVYVANHQSHLDTPAILTALGVERRRTTAVAAAEDYFFVRKGVVNRLSIYLLNLFPFCRSRDRIDANQRRMRALVASGTSILIFPEGTRTTTGIMAPFKKGIGHIVKDLNVPVVPLKVENAYNLMRRGTRFPSAGVVKIIEGRAIAFGLESTAEITRRLEDAVRDLDERAA
jgi:1-acyl-sn-glycerol-3-phosphate acyltransferase